MYLLKFKKVAIYLFVLLGLVNNYSCRTSNSYIHPVNIPQIKQYNVVAYVSGWSNLSIAKMDVKKLTHINYAFAYLNEQGQVFFYNRNDSLKIDTLRMFKKDNPNLKIIVSIGGWTLSKHFSDIAAKQKLSKKCAQHIADFVQRHKIDGVDIDWEYPCMKGAGNPYRPDDKKNFTSFLCNIRNALTDLEISQKRNDPYILSIATATSDNYLNSIEPLEVLKYIDFMHVMAYDYRSGSSWETGHHSNLWTSLADWSGGSCIDKTIQRYFEAGVPAERIIMGVPFYGRKWQGVNKANNGLYQPAKTTGLSIHYRTICKNYTLQKGYFNFWDDSAQAPYLWNPQEGVFISYENPQSLRYKVDYMKQKELNGIMFWEYNSDYNGELLNTIIHHLENDRYAYKKQQNLFTTTYLLGAQSLPIHHLFSSYQNNKQKKSNFAAPFDTDNNLIIKMLTPIIASIQFGQFFVSLLPLYNGELI